MPNPNYKRGTNFEREVARLYRQMGWFAQTSKGSHGVDVVAISPTYSVTVVDGHHSVAYPKQQLIHFTHCHDRKTGPWLAPEEKQRIIEEARQYGAVPMIAYRIKTGKMRGWTRCEEVL